MDARLYREIAEPLRDLILQLKAQHEQYELDQKATSDKLHHLEQVILNGDSLNDRPALVSQVRALAAEQETMTSQLEELLASLHHIEAQLAGLQKDKDVRDTWRAKWKKLKWDVFGKAVMQAVAILIAAGAGGIAVYLGFK